MIFSDSLLINLFGFVLALFLMFITYFKWNYQYWERRKLPYLEPSIPFGNFPNPLREIESFGSTMRRIYEEMKSKSWKHGGIYLMATPTYFPLNLDYVKNILTKDFQHFVDRGIYYDEDFDPIGAHLFAIGGTKWRNLRTKLTPTFTSGKMKIMFQTLMECEFNLRTKFESEYKKGEPIDIKNILGCFTTDVIGSCAFGLECNTFKEDDSLFRKYGKKVFNISKFRRALVAFFMNFPETARFLRIRQVPKDISDFFTKVVKDTVEYREKNNYSRKDFMQLLIEMKNNDLRDEDGHKHDGTSLTVEEITAQCFLFFIAGFETSSTTMTFALYELAKNQDIQETVREEINTVLKRYGGKMTYEAVQDMKYMNQVINETLRKYPPLPVITRKCVKDYKIPNEDIVIEKGVKVVIPIIAIHYDPEYYPDPEKFDPERFNEENFHGRHSYAHIPFGEGPRICLGLRFGLMQTKVGLSALLRNYKLTLSEKTKQPLKFQVNSFIPAAEGDIWLNAEELY